MKPKQTNGFASHCLFSVEPLLWTSLKNLTDEKRLKRSLRKLIGVLPHNTVSNHGNIISLAKATRTLEFYNSAPGPDRLLPAQDEPFGTGEGAPFR